MRLKGGIAMALVAVALVAVPPAQAASTRAEYVAQVDPICQASAGPLSSGFATYQAAFRRAVRSARKGNIKAFIRAARATANSLIGLSQIHANLANQIQPVQPVATDAAAVSSWLNALRQEGGFEAAAASALQHAKIRVFFSNLNQADTALAAGKSAIAGFGFHVCGVTVA